MKLNSRKKKFESLGLLRVTAIALTRKVIAQTCNEKKNEFINIEGKKQQGTFHRVKGGEKAQIKQLNQGREGGGTALEMRQDFLD